MKHPKNHPEIIDFWITDTYHPQRIDNSTTTFMDLCFGLMANENVVLGQYLANFFERQDETWINIAMVLTKDMLGMITSYNKSKLILQKSYTYVGLYLQYLGV